MLDVVGVTLGNPLAGLGAAAKKIARRRKRRPSQDSNLCVSANHFLADLIEQKIDQVVINFIHFLTLNPMCGFREKD